MKVIPYLMAFSLVACSTHKTYESDNKQESEADAMADESYLRWDKEKLKQSEHKVVDCYQGKAKQTLEAYKKDYLEKSKAPYYWLHIGNCFYSNEEWTKAEFFYRMTLEESKSATTKSIAYNNLGLVQFKYEQWEKGKEYLWESAKMSTKFKVPRYNLSQLYLQFGQYDRAITLLNDNVFRGQKDADINFSLANAHLYKGELSKAGSYFSLIPKSKFRREDVAATYALYLIKKGDFKEAAHVMDDREKSGNPEVSAISDKIMHILSQKMKE